MVKGKPAATAPAPVAAPIAVLKQSDVIEAFKTHALNWQRQSLTVACSAAVCLVIGAFSNGDKIEHDVMIDKLKKAVGMTGISDSQVAKYVGLARAFVNHLAVRFKVGGPIMDVLTAKLPEQAIEVLAEYLAKQKVHTLEGMTVMFDKYRRKAAPRAPGTVARRTPPVAPTEREVIVAGDSSETGVVVHTQSGESPEAARQRGLSIILKSLPADFVVLTAVQAGHHPGDLAVAAINMLMTASDIEAVERSIKERRSHLKATTPRIIERQRAAA